MYRDCSNLLLIGGKDMEKVTEEDYKIINEYYQGSGHVFDDTNKMVKSEDAKKVYDYVNKTDKSRLEKLEVKLKSMGEDITDIENTLDNLDTVLNLHGDGTYYVMVQ